MEIITGTYVCKIPRCGNTPKGGGVISSFAVFASSLEELQF